ncbi:helix-turn-helix transcriptional regulator [Formosa sp. PL04]|uniref:helix-turn-helix domain-containing protein n=1 Tax=Formosa sp. PL04 TaxID=3081755 RepID=UPI0029823058|nr:helix-turn-helix transcriptional regulator [Formosa sp. PL04]MDW5288021.1 helix-turn-helix transcriptional regulator [Formosa sp. PL04]
MSLFGKNIRKIRSIKSLSQQAFADIFELKRGTLGAYEEGRSEPKIETIIKIANYFSITIDAILTKELTVNELLKFNGDLESNHNIEKNEFPKIPCITPKDQDSYIKHSENSNYIKDLHHLSLPVEQNKKLRAFIVDNLEMSSDNSGLFPKDIVIGEWIPKSDFDTLENPSICILLTSKDIVLKRIHPSKNKFTLRADHSGIEEYTINHSEVNELWEIRYVFNYRVPELKNNQILNKLAYLEHEFKKLKSSL